MQNKKKTKTKSISIKFSIPNRENKGSQNGDVHRIYHTREKEERSR
jgi:hypothetical protein